MNKNYYYKRKTEKIDYKYSEVRQMPCDIETAKIDFKSSLRLKQMINQEAQEKGITSSQLLRDIVLDYFVEKIAGEQFWEMDDFYETGEICQINEKDILNLIGRN